MINNLTSTITFFLILISTTFGQFGITNKIVRGETSSISPCGTYPPTNDRNLISTSTIVSFGLNVTQEVGAISLKFGNGSNPTSFISVSGFAQRVVAGNNYNIELDFADILGTLKPIGVIGTVAVVYTSNFVSNDTYYGTFYQCFDVVFIVSPTTSTTQSVTTVSNQNSSNSSSNYGWIAAIVIPLAIVT